MTSSTEIANGVNEAALNPVRLMVLIISKVAVGVSEAALTLSLMCLMLIGFGLSFYYYTILWSVIWSATTQGPRELVTVSVPFALGMLTPFYMSMPLWRSLVCREKELTLTAIRREEIGPAICADTLAHIPWVEKVTIIDTPWWAIPLSLFALPGLLATILMMSLNTSYMGLQNSSYILGAIVILPVFIGYQLLLKLSNKYFQIITGTHGIVVISGSPAKQSIAWENVKSVKVAKLESVDLANYHADDFDQQILILEHENSRSIRISLDTLNQKQRVKLARELRQHLSSKVFTESGLNFVNLLAPNKMKKKLPREIKENNAGSELTTFTEMWQRDMKKHIGRTNYVPLEVGALLQEGSIKIISYLSSGGFSTTYVAERGTVGGDREVIVIKESSLPQGLNEQAKRKISDMFAREARLLTKCNHPQIAKVLDYFHEDGREYLALEYLNGVRMSDVVTSQSRISEAQCVEWACELAGLLVYLHGMDPPIIHRDFTPDNVILTSSGQLHLIDFGAANEFLGGATGTLVGKQSYIAPEQFQGKATTQSDIYALGAMLYFALTAEEPVPLSAAHPRSLRPELSVELDELIARCTAPDTGDRIGSAQELLQILGRLSESTGSTQKIDLPTMAIRS